MQRPPEFESSRAARIQRVKDLFADKFGIRVPAEDEGDLYGDAKFVEAFHAITSFNELACFPVPKTRFFEVLFKIFNEPDLMRGLDEYVNDRQVARARVTEDQSERES